MFSFNHLLVGLFMVAAGVAMVKFSFRLLRITGPQNWMEKYTGPGSTSGMYKVFGVGLILLGFLFATGFGADAVNFLFSPLKGIFQSASGG